MHQVWNEIRKMKGRTLETLDRRKPFTIVAITDHTVTVLPVSTGKERPIARTAIENAFQHLQSTGQLTLAEIEKEYASRNPVYVAAMLVELPRVQYRQNPIRLFMQKQ